MNYLFANWKMYLNLAASVELANKLAHVTVPDKVTVGIFPNTLAFSDVKAELKDTRFGLGAQNVSYTPLGAYTGATSALMFKEAGARYALVGHSERRYLFGETNEDVRKKLEACLDVGIIPILCIGETAADIADEKIEYRLKKQLMKALENLSLTPEQLIICYEPVWAISQAGVGTACEPSVAEERLVFIANEIKNYLAVAVPLIYGGSVGADNIAAYMAQPSIDGVLVGHASTRPEEWEHFITALTV